MKSLFIIKTPNNYKHLSAQAKSTGRLIMLVARQGGINLGTGFLTPYSFTTSKNQ